MNCLYLTIYNFIKKICLCFNYDTQNLNEVIINNDKNINTCQYSYYPIEEEEQIIRRIIYKPHKIPLNEKIILCQKYYNDYHKLPNDNEYYEGFNISKFIHSIKKGHHKEIKEILEKIFNQKIK